MFESFSSRANQSAVDRLIQMATGKKEPAPAEEEPVESEKPESATTVAEATAAEAAAEAFAETVQEAPVEAPLTEPVSEPESVPVAEVQAEPVQAEPEAEEEAQAEVPIASVSEPEVQEAAPVEAPPEEPVSEPVTESAAVEAPIEAEPEPRVESVLKDLFRPQRAETAVEPFAAEPVSEPEPEADAEPEPAAAEAEPSEEVAEEPAIESEAVKEEVAEEFDEQTVEATSEETAEEVNEATAEQASQSAEEAGDASESTSAKRVRSIPRYGDLKDEPFNLEKYKQRSKGRKGADVFPSPDETTYLKSQGMTPDEITEEELRRLSQDPMWKTLVQFKGWLPVVTSLLPMLDLASGRNNAAGADEMKDTMDGLLLSNRDVRATLHNQTNELRRVEDEVAKLRDAADKTAFEQTEMANDVRAMQRLLKSTSLYVGILLGLLVAVVGYVAFLVFSYLNHPIH